MQNIPKVTGKTGSMTQHSVQCFHGRQVEQYPFEKSEAHNDGKLKWNKVVQTNEEVKTENLLSGGSEPKHSKKTKSGLR